MAINLSFMGRIYSSAPPFIHLSLIPIPTPPILQPLVVEPEKKKEYPVFPFHVLSGPCIRVSAIPTISMCESLAR